MISFSEYVHRIGRTGRAGNKGMSITIIERRDRKQAQDLIKILEEAGQDVPEELSNMADRYARWKERDDEAKAEFRASGI